MATVIDELIVELKLDPKGFTEGQRKMTDSLRDMERKSEQTKKRVSSGADDMTKSFSLLQGRLLAIGGLFMGGMGIRQFIEHMTKLTAQTGYFSAAIGVSARELGKWQGAGATVGAQAGEIGQSFAAIRHQMAQMQLYGTSQLNAFAQATHQKGQGPAVQLYNQDGSWRSPTEILMSISRWAQAQKNPTIASQLMGSFGMSPGMQNLLRLGPEELKRRLDRSESMAPSQEEVDRLQKLQEAFGDMAQQAEKLGRAIVSFLSPGLVKFLKTIEQIMDTFQKKGFWDGVSAANDAASEGVGDAYGSFTDYLKRGGSWLWDQGRGLMGLPPSGGGASGGGGGGRGGGTGGASGGWGSNDAPPGVAKPGSGAPSTTSPPNPASVGPGSSEFMRRRRAAFKEQIDNTPGLRERIGGMLALEGTPLATVESLFNRLDYVNAERAKRGLPPKTIDDMLNGGFYGPINRGQHGAGIAQYRRNPKKYDSAIDRALGGSHIIGGFTDQGMPTDPNGSKSQLRRYGFVRPFIHFGGNDFNDWGGGPGGHRGAESYRKMIEEGLARERDAKRREPPSPLTTMPYGGGAAQSFERWRALGLGAQGAIVGGTSHNTRSSTTNIDALNVTVPPGADPAAYAAGIQGELSRYDDTVMHANSGMF